MIPAMEHPAVAQKLRPIAIENSRTWLIHPLLPLDLFRVPPATQRLSEIHVPTLLIVGERDQPDIQNIVGLLKTGIAGVPKVVVPGVGHMVNMERAEDFNRIVLDFLSTR